MIALVLAILKSRLRLRFKLPDGRETVKLQPESLAAAELHSPFSTNSLIAGLTALLKQRQKASGSPPIICIDEADVLMD